MEGGTDLWTPLAALVTALTGGVAAIIIAMKGKKSDSPSEAQATVLAGSITDGRKLDQLTQAIEAHKETMRDIADEKHRDDRALTDSLDTLSRRLQENTDAHRAGAAMPYDARLAALISQLKDK